MTGVDDSGQEVFARLTAALEVLDLADPRNTPEILWWLNLVVAEEGRQKTELPDRLDMAVRICEALDIDPNAELPESPSSTEGPDYVDWLIVLGTKILVTETTSEELSQLRFRFVRHAVHLRPPWFCE